MKTGLTFFVILLLVIGCKSENQDKKTVIDRANIISSYEELNSSILQGWNTWDNRDIMSHVLLPRGIKLQMKNWNEHGLVLENYHAEHGGYPGYRSEYFYHWGALLSMINMIEHGHVPPTETAIK